MPSLTILMKVTALPTNFVCMSSYEIAGATGRTSGPLHAQGSLALTCLQDCSGGRC